MPDIRLRPRFRVAVECETGTLVRTLEQSLAKSTAGVRGSVYKSSSVLRVPLADVHFWSPQLEVSVNPDGDTCTIIHGIYGPRPAIWSMFIALYVGVGFVGSMGVIFGYSQMILGNPAWAFWAGPVAIVLSLFIYAIARMGRRLGYNQMVLLRGFLDDVIRASSTDS